MADKQFDVEAAKNWQREVEQEFSEVNRLLIRVSRECQSDPSEDDTILNDIIQKGQQMEVAMNKLGEEFKELSNAISKIANAWEKAVQEGLDKMKDWASNFHLG